MDAPNNSNIQSYVQEMRVFGVSDIVRTCEKTYDEKTFEQAGVYTHELVFPDGEPPPDEVISKWLTILKTATATTPPGVVAIHCVAGLGRAPVLVAVALIEAGMEALDAILFIRERRKGAINARQLTFLETYKRRRIQESSKGCAGKCTIL
eukprot:GHVL01045001.1.p1 GENE.GHVL01045001.1~~GHVL01045001.1.p1  ORF type:complete len:151 (+),score=30.00 GHVL01045001.1:485-937(+)